MIGRLKKVFRSSATGTAPEKQYLHESDVAFHELFQQGATACSMHFGPGYKIERRYNTWQIFRSVMHLNGALAECGCYRGLTTYMLCHLLRKSEPNYTGSGYFCVDSFEGLSQPTAADAIQSSDYGTPGAQSGSEGMFSATLDEVRAALREFPDITYLKGWIPAPLHSLPEQSYRFVHLDLDLYEPTRDALHYFYPRLVPGGVIALDEYGLPRWPGAQKATDEFCAELGIQPLALTTGNAAIYRLGRD